MQYSFHEANLTTDKKEILEFWKTSLPELPSKKFSWFYIDNPCSPALCWIIKENETNMVIGSVAVFPKRFFVKGKYFIGGMTGDLGVHKHFRVLGPALKLLKMKISALKKEPIDFFYNYPNKLSQPLLRRAGYKVLGDNLVFVKVLKSVDYVKRYVKNDLISKFISSIIDFVLKLISKEYYIDKNNEYYSEIQSRFDKKFDDMWDRLTPQIDLIVSERTSNVLNWRYRECPFKEYRVFTLCRKQTNELSGYIVYEVDNGRITIADVFVENNDSVFDVLMSEFLFMSRGKKVKSILFSFLGNKLMANRLSRFSFSKRGSNIKVYVYSDPLKLLDDHFLNEDNWYLTVGDNDV